MTEPTIADLSGPVTSMYVEFQSKGGSKNAIFDVLPALKKKKIKKMKEQTTTRDGEDTWKGEKI